MKGPTTRGPVGYGFSQFRENWCPACGETFQTEEKEPRPTRCRYCGSDMPKKPVSQVGIQPAKRKYGRPVKGKDD